MNHKSLIELCNKIKSEQLDDLPESVIELLNKIPFILNELESLRQENRILINHFTRNRSRDIKQKVNQTIDKQDIEEMPLLDEHKLFKQLIQLHHAVSASKMAENDFLTNTDYNKGVHNGQLSMLGMLANFYINDKELREQLREHDMFVPLKDDEIPFDQDILSDD